LITQDEATNFILQNKDKDILELIRKAKEMEDDIFKSENYKLGAPHVIKADRERVLVKALCIYHIYGLFPLIVHAWNTNKHMGRLDYCRLRLVWKYVCLNDESEEVDRYLEHIRDYLPSQQPDCRPIPKVVEPKLIPIIKYLYNHKLRETDSHIHLIENDTLKRDVKTYIYDNVIEHLIIPLVPKGVKDKYEDVLAELTYMPPNSRMPLGGIDYQSGLVSYNQAIKALRS